MAAEHADSAHRCLDADGWERLTTLRAAVDPGSRMVANHRI